MKKLVLILTLAAFACSPMLTTPASAAQKHSKHSTGKKHHHHKKHKKHKK